MKRKQDIEQFFRDQQHKLDERPPSRAWDRLEQRLEQQRTPQSSRQDQGGRTRRLRPRLTWLSMAASLLLLVAMLTTISLFFRNTTTEMSTAQALPAPVMEVLQPYDDQTGVYTIAVSFQRHLNQSPRQLNFAEGTKAKKLRSTPDKTPEYRSGIAAAGPRLKAAPKRRETAIAKTKRQANGAAEPTAKDRTYDATPPPQAYSADTDTYLNTDSTQVVASAAPPNPSDDAISSGSVAADAPAGESTEVAAQLAEPSDPSLEIDPNEVPINSDVTQLNVTTNILLYEGQGNNIDQFRWLIGQWSEKIDADRETVEEWRQTDAFTIEGKGKLVVNGDTTFTEGMKIQKIGENLYFILALDEREREVKFRLRSYNQSVAIFETEQPAMMNQLILQQAGFNNFSTTLQNVTPQVEVADEIPEYRYLQNRNYVEPERQRISRSLSRVRE
ncbi:MAG: DUF6265 family protein [Bacteroidota bacterium]